MIQKVGTGQLGLDPGFVCESMISSAREYLNQHKIDVKFVIYPINDSDEDECYQVFRIYLESLFEQNQTDQNQFIKKQIQSCNFSFLEKKRKQNKNEF